MQDRNRMLTESIRRLLRRGAAPNLSKIVNKAHAADLSVVFRSLSISQQRYLFDMIEDRATQAAIFSELDEDALHVFIEEIPLEDVVGILEELPSDDVADILGELPEEKSQAILDLMHDEGSEEIVVYLTMSDACCEIDTSEVAALVWKERLFSTGVGSGNISQAWDRICLVYRI